MRGAYVTKRAAPDGWVAVTRPLAREKYDNGCTVVLCGSNVNSFHVFGGWRLGMPVHKDTLANRAFDEIVASFMSYLESELGKRPVFYVRKGALCTGDA